MRTLVKKCINRVIGLQRENGAWALRDEKTAVSTTINVLRVLKCIEFGSVERATV